jgi:polysaccharide export outer membrane protein
MKPTLWTTRILLMLAAIVALAGCETYTDYSSFIRDPKPIVSDQAYRIAPPDTIMITSKRIREINNHREQIRPDGKITLPLLGSYFIAGKTCEEASAELQAIAKEFYDDADVSLRVVGYASKKIFVFGEVSLAGPYPYDGSNTVLETLAIAQPTRLADPTRIHILRPGPNNTLVKRMTINLDKMVKTGDCDLDAVLEEGDIVYVPANGLATVGLALQQVLLPIQPAASTVQAPSTFDTSFRSEPLGNSSNVD